MLQVAFRTIGRRIFVCARRLIEKLEPPYVGWASVKQEIFETVDFWDVWGLRLSETASRFEVGTPSAVSFVGAAEAMKMLLNFGIENIERRVIELTDYLIERVKALGLSFKPQKNRKTAPA